MSDNFPESKELSPLEEAAKRLREAELKPVFEVDAGTLSDEQAAELMSAIRSVREAHKIPDTNVFIPMPTPAKPPPMFGTGEDGAAKGEPLPPQDYSTAELTLEEQRLLASHRLRRGEAHWESLTPAQRQRVEDKWGDMLEGIEVSVQRRHALLALFDLELLAPMPTPKGES